MPEKDRERVGEDVKRDPELESMGKVIDAFVTLNSGAKSPIKAVKRYLFGGKAAVLIHRANYGRVSGHWNATDPLTGCKIVTGKASPEVALKEAEDVIMQAGLDDYSRAVQAEYKELIGSGRWKFESK